MDEPLESDKRPVFRDIRRYFCEYCGICRSKKTLIASHINSHHKVNFCFFYYYYFYFVRAAKLNLFQARLSILLSFLFYLFWVVVELLCFIFKPNG